MNAFDLNRKEYIRVNNNSLGALPDYAKVTFLYSFVLTADLLDPLPTVFSAVDVFKANDGLKNNAAAACYSAYPASAGYACYIAEMGVVNVDRNINLPYAKVNVYAMDGRDL